MSAAEPEVIPPEKSEKKKPSKALAKREPEQVSTTGGPATDIQMLMLEATRAGNLELMKELMSIRRELKAEAAKEAFFEAMAAFQKECPVIKRTKPVWNKEHTKVIYNYAPLDYIEKIAGPHIHKHGLSYSFKARIEQGEKGQELVMECHIQHDAGHSEISPFRLPISGDYMNELQKSGNTNSYAKRYSFCNAFGILSEDDDQDGQIAPQQTKQAPREVRQPKPTPTAQRTAEAQQKVRADIEPAGEGDVAIDEAMGADLAKAMKHGTLGLSDLQKRFPKIERLGQIKKEDLTKVLSWIADPAKN